jgi:SAM-dependent methyltransferase
MTAAQMVPVDPSNAAQLRAWDGDEGAFWAAHADHFDRSVAAYHDALMDAVAVGRSDRVLDVGCGTGQVARDAARVAVAGSVLGVDLSAAMLDVARQRAAADGLSNVTFEQSDAQVHRFEAGAFDVAVSRTGAMFFGDKVAAFRNIARALRPGGRLVLLTWQSPPGNEWLREFSTAMAAGRDLPAPPPDAPGPFSLSEPARMEALLRDAGFADVTVEGTAAPMWFGRDADDAFDLVSGLLGWMLEGLDHDGKTRALEALRTTIAAHATPDGVLYESATWTTRATRP